MFEKIGIQTKRKQKKNIYKQQFLGEKSIILCEFSLFCYYYYFYMGSCSYSLNECRLRKFKFVLLWRFSAFKWSWIERTTSFAIIWGEFQSSLCKNRRWNLLAISLMKNLCIQLATAWNLFFSKRIHYVNIFVFILNYNNLDII